MKLVILVTGASSAFGVLTVRELAQAGHIVYASMHATEQYNVPQVQAARRFALEHKVDLRTVDLDVSGGRGANRTARMRTSACRSA